MVYDHAVHFYHQVNQYIESLLCIVIVKKKDVIELYISSVFAVAGQAPKAFSYAHFAADGPVRFSVFDAVDRRLAFGIVLPEQGHCVLAFDDLL